MKKIIDKDKLSKKWWNKMSKDDQMWLMMEFGFSTPFNPDRVSNDEILKMYNLKHN